VECRRLPARSVRLQVASTQGAVYKSQRPVVPRGVGMARLHLTEKEERKNGLGELIDIHIFQHGWIRL
jgi:hypothetical protein